MLINSGLFHTQNTIRIIGHRGCRGIMPENSIEGFKKAFDPKHRKKTNASNGEEGPSAQSPASILKGSSKNHEE